MIIQNSVLLLKSQISTDGQDKYEKALKMHKFEVRQVKTLTFNFKNIPELREKFLKYDEYSGIILSSPRCVEAVSMAIENLPGYDRWKFKNNFTVGETTWKIALEKLGLDCKGKETGNAVNLSQMIVQDKHLFTKPFLFPHGNLKTDTLSLDLGKVGLEIEGVEVYDTISNPDIEGELAKVTGFNSSIDFISKVPVDFKELIAIGPVTELAITEKGLQVYGVADKPNPESMLQAILKKQ